jgi:hypothetical protein
MEFHHEIINLSQKKNSMSLQPTKHKISSREAPLCRINAYVLQPWAHIGKDLALTMDRKVL